MDKWTNDQVDSKTLVNLKNPEIVRHITTTMNPEYILL